MFFPLLKTPSGTWSFLLHCKLIRAIPHRAFPITNRTMTFTPSLFCLCVVVWWRSRVSCCSQKPPRFNPRSRVSGLGRMSRKRNRVSADPTSPPRVPHFTKNLICSRKLLLYFQAVLSVVPPDLIIIRSLYPTSSPYTPSPLDWTSVSKWERPQETVIRFLRTGGRFR